MKIFLSLLLTCIVAFAPTYTFAQTEVDETDTATETVEDTETTTEDEQLAEEQTETEEEDITTTPTAETLDETLTTNTTEQSTTEAKTITDYLPYILLAGAGILLISIIAIIFSGKGEKKEKKIDLKATQEEKEAVIKEETPKTVTPPVGNPIESLVQKPTEENIATDLEALTGQPTPKVEEPVQETTPVVEETPQVIQEVQPVVEKTQTLDEPIDDVAKIQEIVKELPKKEEPVQQATISPEVPMVEESPQVEINTTPLTDTPVKNLNIQTPTLHTNPVEEVVVTPEVTVEETPAINPVLTQLSEEPVQETTPTVDTKDIPDVTTFLAGQPTETPKPVEETKPPVVGMGQPVQAPKESNDDGILPTPPIM